MIKLKNQIINSIHNVTNNLSYPKKECSLAPPKNTEFGDLCSNIALLLAKDLKKSPLETAMVIRQWLQEDEKSMEKTGLHAGTS